MTKKIILSLAMIALVIAGVTSATVAYFSDVAVREGNTFSMGTVEVTQADGWGLPYTLSNMIPCEQRESSVITVKNIGSVPIDLYFGERWASGDGDFRGVVDYAINEVASDGTVLKTWVNWQDIVSLFTTWNKVADNIPANGYKRYKFYVKLDCGMDDTFQGKSATNDIILYAVQHDAPAPTTPAPADWTEN